MKENEPEKYQAYLEKMRVYLKMRRDKMHELKKSKKNKYKYIYVYIYIKFYKNNFIQNNFLYKILKGLKTKCYIIYIYNIIKIIFSDKIKYDF